MIKVYKQSLLLFFSFLIGITALAQENAKPVFKDGEAQIVGAFSNPDKWIRHDLWVETEFNTDGDDKPDRMHVSVTRPAQTDSEGLKLPIIYVTSPYFAGVAGDVDGLFWDVKHELGEASKTERMHPEVTRRGQRPIISNSHIGKWVPRGYIVVHSSSPGTGLSQGAPTVGGDNESLAPKAVVDWLCGRANGYTSPDGNEKVEAFWSTGKVGMTGTSYNGTLPLAAATTGVKGLEAIIPIAPNTSYYHYYRSNGLVRSPGGYLGEDIDVLYDFINSGGEELIPNKEYIKDSKSSKKFIRKRDYANKTVRDTEMANGMDRASGDYNEFWASRDYLNDMKPMKAALLMSHGFNDWNVMPEHSYRIYKKAKEMGLPTQIYYHQFGHGGPPPITMMNRWFTRYLHGVENGVEQDARAWIVREFDDMAKPTAYKDYPNPDAKDVTLQLGAGGNTKGTLSSKKTNGKETLVDDYSFSGKDLATAETSKNRLLYTTPILTEDLHISGVPKVSITLSSSKPAANLSVWLVSLPWNAGNTKKTRITENIITRGWADPQNYKSLTESEPLEPGKFYTVTFDLQPDDQIIKKGQQIGLMIFSSDSNFTLLPEAGTELTIKLEDTSLTLPILGGKASYSKATNN
ncbi:Xaa-Pro dipeptidyl-peptidase [Ichthyenterobacterium sp. W332]|uniref:Xaa-Pro dipeptidyl-peptidase n=1 Tax=Microcosmobacter mediterraneus TaxID=3075607 RepID=A0ABU2YGZ3_9FLAO|nr:Xaa-Pro dipeptidyl-peptidase [Ichthyenterobacterium sp. W332]MDT0557451.1 Xaa-Pro dipeptidyl-peptidase [Ichthyenterobacterium sp. W332]